MRHLTQFCFIASLLVGFTTVKANDGLTVNTQQGNVTGSLIVPTVRRFLGIPYAKAGRWQPPTSPPVRSGMLNVTKFSARCYQSELLVGFNFLSYMGFESQFSNPSEDCLTLNIWAPSVARKQSTAILIWIHGGAFQVGTGADPAYDGKQFVLDYDDIIVVTMNYRVNIFGQPNAPQLISSTQSQNFGLLDIDTAIRWVHSNIAGFGGDPNRIILAGHSAGSVAIDAYTYVHPDDTIVKGIIMQSGTLDLVTSAPVSRIGVDEANVTAWNQAAHLAGCSKDPTEEQFACMLAADADSFVYFVVNPPIFYPIIDDITLFSNQAERAAAGNFLQVPMLGGTTDDEGRIFSIVSKKAVNITIAVDPTRDPISDLFTQMIFTCPARKAALDRINAGVPTWRYEYQARLPPGFLNSCCHASDVSVIFGTYNSTLDAMQIYIKPTNTQLEETGVLSQALMSAWVAFARNPAMGLAQPPFLWPKFGSGGNNIVTFGNFSSSNGVSVVSEVPNDLMCGNMGLALEHFNAAHLNFPFVF